MALEDAIENTDKHQQTGHEDPEEPDEPFPAVKENKMELAQAKLKKAIGRIPKYETKLLATKQSMMSSKASRLVGLELASLSKQAMGVRRDMNAELYRKDLCTKTMQKSLRLFLAWESKVGKQLQQAKGFLKK